MSGLLGPLQMLQKLLSRRKPEVSLEELSALRRVIHPVGAPEARSALNIPVMKHEQALSDNDFNRRMISTEMQQKTEEAPTTAFYGPNSTLAGAYQLDPGKWGTEISYLLSNQPGLGKQLLEDAYRAAKQVNPDKRVVLSAIPGSEGFYRKQIPYGWAEGSRDGVPIFIRRARGGLAQIVGDR